MSDLVDSGRAFCFFDFVRDPFQGNSNVRGHANEAIIRQVAESMFGILYLAMVPQTEVVRQIVRPRPCFETPILFNVDRTTAELGRYGQRMH